MLNFMRLLWSFSRPHTIIGTILSVAALGLMAAVLPTPLRVTFEDTYNRIIIPILIALLPSTCANIYIVGLNQLTDVEIDRINKPNLPLASGQLSFTQSLWLIILSGFFALLLAISQGSILLVTVALSMAIGTCYSLPPIRLKRFPVWSALCIFSVRGIIVNLGFYLYFSNLFGRFNQISLGSSSIPPEVWALSQFVVLFTLAIAFLKDVPDIEGDRMFNIFTLTVRLGSYKVFRLSTWLISTCYLLIAVYAAFGLLPSTNPHFIILSQLSLLVLFWKQNLNLNIESKHQVSRYYQFIWKLFFLEYIIFPIGLLLPIL